MDTSSASMDNKTVEVDGSYGEGGGQIIRNSVTLSCILRRKMEVVNIRANRPNPGLASQHLESINAMLRITGAKTSQEPKKQDLSFDIDATDVLQSSSSPGVDTTIDLKTAGSCTLCIQCILPYLMCLRGRSRISIIGGTHVLKAPSFDYFERVFLPIFNTILKSNNGNGRVTAELRRPGYFPRGGGNVILHVEPNQGKYSPFSFVERGSFRKAEAILNVTSFMEADIPRLKAAVAPTTRDIEVRIVPYASIEVFLYFEHSPTGFSYLVEGRRPTSEQLMEGIIKISSQVDEFQKSSAVIDPWCSDQLVIYMGLVKLQNPSSQSIIRSIKPSDHTLSAAHILHLFCPEVQVEIAENEDKSYTIVL